MTTATTPRTAAKAPRAAKAPAPRGRRKTHTKPIVPRVALEAEAVTKQMYESLKAEGAPRATPQGYIMGASMVLKMLIDQAVKQGCDRDELKAQAMTYIMAL